MITSLPTPEVCDQIRKFGYSVSQNIRIYGEEFEVLSDPFASEGGIVPAIQHHGARAFGL